MASSSASSRSSSSRRRRSPASSGTSRRDGQGRRRKLARRIVATFGLDALRVLDEDAERLREVEGLGKAHAGDRPRVARAARRSAT